MTVISFGGGVQSSAMVCWALEGRWDVIPDLALFADTQWEPEGVYIWLKRLLGVPYERYVRSDGSIGFRAIPGLHCGGELEFPTHIVTKGSIRENASPRATREGRRFITLPTFQEGGGMGRRQCTSEFKLRPMQRSWRERGATAKNPVECWIGISTDECHRMKPSRVKYAVNRFPLIEAGISREDCGNYLKARFGMTPSKSSCVGCPYHDDDYWAALRRDDAAAFADACEFDLTLRDPRYRLPDDGKGQMRPAQYLHRSLIPLQQIGEFKHEKQGRMFFDGFGNECEGLCGL